MNRATLVLSGLAVVFALAAGLRSAERQRPGPRIMGLPLTLVKVEEGSITVKSPPMRTEAAKETTLATSKERTKVFVGEVTDEQKTGDGTIRRTAKLRPGTLADLKAGQRVLVMTDNGLATEIRIMSMPEEKGEGKKRGGKE